MRVRRSSAIAITLESDRFVFHDFLARQTFAANTTALEIVRHLHGWTDLEAVAGILPGYSRDSVERAISQLIDLGVVLVEDSEAADRDDDFQTQWLWGPWAAAYHFGARDGVYISADDSDLMLRQQAKFMPSPRLYATNNTPATDISLPVGEDYPEPFKTMARRRTHRVMLDEPIALDRLADCLLFSMAITAVIEDPEVVDLPLKMTPSGGARNPYEAYVYARNVEGLTPGAYHYSAMQRTLGRVGEDGPTRPLPGLLAGQDWTADAAAVIFLVANFERPMWKYHDPAAYRVTLIEAGHIAQNISLVATAHGLAASPSGALAHTRIEDLLGVGGVNQAVIYAVILGVPDPSSDSTPPVPPPDA